MQDGGHRHVGKISSGDISATGRPINFMFCSRVGFSRTADLMALLPVRTNPRWRQPPSWQNFEWPYLRNGSRSTYIPRIARSSLRLHSFLVICIKLQGPKLRPILHDLQHKNQRKENQTIQRTQYM